MAQAGAWAGFAWGLRRDLRLSARSTAEVLVVLGFFLIVTTLFPLSVGPEPRILHRIGAGIIWVCATLACLLSLHRMFALDFADGSLEQMLFGNMPFPSIVAGKIGAHWLTTGCPLMVCAPLVGVQFGLSTSEIGVLLASLALGTPVLSLIGAIMAALTLGLRGGGALLALLLLPLYIPLLVFGVGAVDAHAAGLGVEGHLSVLGAELLLAAVGAPLATAAAARTAID
ncbi:MAG: heme exporter protein CcmB [Betaproteobacteria bacterium]|nr:MAG: heme exporter protein CcmB [Betaproteobacteria bacterium]